MVSRQHQPAPQPKGTGRVDTQASAPVVPATQPGTGSAGAVIDVLLLEADHARALVIVDALAPAGGRTFRITRATSGAEALEEAAGAQPAVVLVGKTGADEDRDAVLAALRPAAPDALILPLTASDMAATPAAFAWLPATLLYVVRRNSREAALRAANEALFEDKERARVTLQSIGDAVLVTDLRGCVIDLNPVAEGLTGWSSVEATGRSLADVFPVMDGTSGASAEDPARRAMAADQVVELEANCVLMRRDGTEVGIEDSAAPVHDRNGQVAGAVIVFRHVDHSRAANRRLAYLAQHDPLTGLANRALLDERLEQTLRWAERHGSQAALLFVDINDFKVINDDYGHQLGDQVLQAVATFLDRSVRDVDTVSRLGGDEFVILLTEINMPSDAHRVADKILAAFDRPLSIDGDQLHVGISVGVAVYPRDGTAAETLLACADRSMYSAKRASGETDSDDPVPASQALRQALERDELVLHYQPQIALASGALAGAEALIRWPHSGGVLQPPADFLYLADNGDLAVMLGHWVLATACRQAVAWQDHGAKGLPVSVNVGAAMFHAPDFVRDVATILETTGATPGNIELELREDVLMADPDAARARLEGLRALGVRVAIDNFGTGAAALEHVLRFTVDTVKLDRTFMPGVDYDERRALILRSLLGLGRSLGSRVVAQGVETIPQLGFLRANGCDAAQGFQLGHPLSASDCSLLLALHAGRVEDIGSEPAPATINPGRQTITRPAGARRI